MEIFVEILEFGKIETRISRERIHAREAKTAEIFTAYFLTANKYALFPAAYVLPNVIATVREKLQMLPKQQPCESYGNSCVGREKKFDKMLSEKSL